MNTNKKKFGQFYTKNYDYILNTLLDVFPEKSNIIDPFAGEGDLMKMGLTVKGYDIDPKLSNIQFKDSLLNPIDYNNKWILTNPPYLARNKTNNKDIYDYYNVNDLYKASLLSIMDSLGGVIILPLNFFSNEDDKIRKVFLSKFKIKKLNIFEEKVFSDTDYTVCSFSFIRETNNNQNIKVKFYPSGKNITFNINYNNGYKFGYEFFKLFKKLSKKVKIGRLVIGGKPNTDMFLRAVDTGKSNGRIKLCIDKKHFYGKQSDRVFATITLSKKMTNDKQIFICNEFNKILENYRKKYNSLFLTNYRNSCEYARKRIGFKTAYNLILYIIEKYNL